MNIDTPTNQFSEFLKKNNLKHRKFHSLRHTSVTLLLYVGVNIKQVQTRLGHSNIETTNKYLHYIEEADVDAVIVNDNDNCRLLFADTRGVSVSDQMREAI